MKQLHKMGMNRYIRIIVYMVISSYLLNQTNPVFDLPKQIIGWLFIVECGILLWKWITKGSNIEISSYEEQKSDEIIPGSPRMKVGKVRRGMRRYRSMKRR